MSKKLKPIRAKMWCGLWLDGSLGWMASKFVEPHYGGMTSEQFECLSPKHGGHGSDFYRVEVIMRPVKDKLGRYIVRRAKRSNP